jgi:hypothetical protein
MLLPCNPRLGSPDLSVPATQGLKNLFYIMAGRNRAIVGEKILASEPMHARLPTAVLIRSNLTVYPVGSVREFLRTEISDAKVRISPSQASMFFISSHFG